MRLHGKVAIITGGGRGLGRASAIAFAAEGASVAIISRTLRELRGTAAVIKEGGGKVLVLKADVSRPQEARAIVGKTLATFGRIDILMNNAAVGGPIKPLSKVTEREWNEGLNVNLRAAFLLSKAVVPSMTWHGGGKIINVTSGLGNMTIPRFGVYSIAKAGLGHLTRILAEELKEYNIQVNGLDPGVMDTRMQDDVRALGPDIVGDETYQEFVALKELGRLKPPERVARLAVFLASAGSDPLTGEIGTEDHYRRFGYE